MQAARTLKADPSRSTLSESTNKGGDSNQSAADLTAKLSKLMKRLEILTDLELKAILDGKGVDHSG